MANKLKTPLLQEPRKQGGTLYVFPSASEDIGLNLNSRANSVALSHYALLRIPDLLSEDSNSFDLRKTDVNNIAQSSDEWTTRASGWLAASLQNYAMNFETLLINQDNYSFQEASTVSERVFWKWLTKTGAIKWKDTGKSTTSHKKIYTEDDDTTYNRVVMCLGSIDAGNSLSTEFGMFNETYVNIPSSYGGGKVFFTSKDDNNYHLNSTYITTNSNETYLEGRTAADNNAALYTINTPFFDEGIEGYKTDSIDGIEIIKTISDINAVWDKIDTRTSHNAKSYDDFNIDETTFPAPLSVFNFNAILLYYSIYDTTDSTKVPIATNLFGILFLNAPIDSTALGAGNLSFTIPTFKKEMSTAAGFGTGYSFRVNIKTNSIFDLQTTINDSTTTNDITAANFSSILASLNRAIVAMNINVHATQTIQEDYTKLVNAYNNYVDDINDLSTRINSYIAGNRTSVLTTQVLNTSTFRTGNSYDSAVMSIQVPDPSAEDITRMINSVSYVNDGINYKKVGSIGLDGMSLINLDASTIAADGIYVNINSYAEDTSITGMSNAKDISEAIINNINIRRSDYDVSVYKQVDGKSVLMPARENVCYIDPESTAFNRTLNINGEVFDFTSLVEDSEDTVSVDGMKINNAKINYEKLIPYMIAWMQTHS